MVETATKRKNHSYVRATTPKKKQLLIAGYMVSLPTCAITAKRAREKPKAIKKMKP